MYLKHIRARNFRAFGDGTTAPELDWTLSPGLNILVGENDAGKTTIVDAIRQILWTTSYESIRLFEQDFHVLGASRADSLVIEATLCDLGPDQQAAVLDWLTHEKDGTISLILHLHARRIPAHGAKRSRVDTIIRAGRNGNGMEVGLTVRDLVRATYLRPLRDAEGALKPGRMSRLSQILGAHASIEGQEENDFNIDAPEDIPKNLVGLMAFAQHHLGKHGVIAGVEKVINDEYLSKFGFAGDALESRIRIAPDLSLTPILERFELSLLPGKHISADERCARGLGYNNALFMATELVLLRDGDELGLLLVEEPEAHLHPQLQDRVMNLLQSHTSGANGKRRVQVILTTHSPSLVSTSDLEGMTLVHKGQTFSLAASQTCLKHSDYRFLQQFLDATKANLFFARGVAMVEGPAEAILLPALAEACGRSFSAHGISVVNVGSVGLFHYARIFQRSGQGPKIPVPVVCITDRDIVPDIASSYVAKPAEGSRRFRSDFVNEADVEEVVKRKEARAEGDHVIVCVSDSWTFEYDLAETGLAKLMHIAIAVAKVAKSKDERLEDWDEMLALANAEESWLELEKKGLAAADMASEIYEPLQMKKASKAVAAQYAAHLLSTGQFGSGDELLARLPKYLQRAINYLTSPLVQLKPTPPESPEPSSQVANALPVSPQVAEVKQVVEAPTNGKGS